MDTRVSPFRARLTQLREVLVREGVDALLVPSADPHLSEYLPARWQGREWLSGFTGSMGTLVVGTRNAALFADSRYWAQAESELAGSGIELVRIHSAAAPAHVDWMIEQVPRGGTVAVDGQVLGLAAAQMLKSRLEAAGITLRTRGDLLDAIWPDRPTLPTQPVYAHVAPHAPRPRIAKLALMREAMQRHGATHHFVSTVDDIAWITNLRGSDVDYNPVFMAHLLLDAQGGRLYIGAHKVPEAERAALAADGIRVLPYGETSAALAALGAGDTLLIDPRRVTLGLRERVNAACKVVEAINPSVLAKSRKTDAEAAFVREAMVEDGAAMCEFYAWLEEALQPARPHGTVTELTIDEHLSAARARRPGFVGLSFSTIAGFNANGAMPHYRATPAHHATIEGDGLLLIDSGGQYLGGTTDITRVWQVGTASAAMKRDYTLVLKGTMALSRTRFPRGTLSPMVDAIARAPLWAEGLDFGHGTGHGVGYFLAVHEGPQSISRAIPEAHMAMEPGMITSIEPGLYRSGQWGVRIENLVLNVPAPTNTEFGEFLDFETLTLCPIDVRCIERSLLRADEIAWLNAYHATARERLAPHVSGAALRWLQANTQPL
jgi:Xaa-Pro aminopeptidase